MLNVSFKILLIFICSIFIGDTYAQERLNSVTIALIKSKKKKVIVDITNHNDSSIFIMSKPITGQGAFRFITSCDSLNSKSHSQPVTLPPNFYRESNMLEVKSKKSKRVKFKTISKWHSISPCSPSEEAYAYLKVYVYNFSSPTSEIVLGYVYLENSIKLVGR